MGGSVMSASHQGATPSPKKATFLAHAPHSLVIRPRSKETLSPNLLSLDRRPSAFNGSGSLHSFEAAGRVRSRDMPPPLEPANRGACVLSSDASNPDLPSRQLSRRTSPDLPSRQLQSRASTAGSSLAAAPTSSDSHACGMSGSSSSLAQVRTMTAPVAEQQQQQAATWMANISGRMALERQGVFRESTV